LETDGLIGLLYQGCLAGSPYADILADPFAVGPTADTPNPVRFMFSDIPDYQFRKPDEVIGMSQFKEGSKS
jgi:hypothetical protein